MSDTRTHPYRDFCISEDVVALSERAMAASAAAFERVDRVAAACERRVLRSFQLAHVSESHFSAKTGYGYDDAGRERAEAVFAHAFGAEDALVRLQFGSGTHVLATCLRALLVPGDDLLIATGRPYDTILPTLGHIVSAETGELEYDEDYATSLARHGVKTRMVDLLPDGTVDLRSLERHLLPETKMVYVQRSRGYTTRPALRSRDVGAVAETVRAAGSDAIVFVDNCYGEFVEATEPTDHGADLIAGSLIKNPGGGLAPCGGYIAGRGDLIEIVADGMTAADVGRHVGPSLGFSRLVLEGLYLAPRAVASALKGAIHAAHLFRLAGFETHPDPDAIRGDLVQTIRLNAPERLTAFCRAVQAASPVDAFVTPVPSPMPGYDVDIIMASGSFIQGSTIELSADGPLRPPYDVFVQGGLTFEQARIGAMRALEAVRALDKEAADGR
ncbi:MAG: methionine gamma-lyase family protein [Saccharofermentanales bacterium]